MEREQKKITWKPFKTVLYNLCKLRVATQTILPRSLPLTLLSKYSLLPPLSTLCLGEIRNKVNEFVLTLLVLLAFVLVVLVFSFFYSRNTM